MEFSIFTETGEIIYNKIGRQKHYYSKFVYEICLYISNYQTDTITLSQIKNPLGMKQRNYSNLIKKLIKIGILAIKDKTYRFFTATTQTKPKAKRYTINHELLNSFIEFYQEMKRQKQKLLEQIKSRLPQIKKDNTPIQVLPQIKFLVEKIIDKNEQNNQTTLETVFMAIDKKYRIQFLAELKRQKEKNIDTDFDILE